MKCPRCRKTVAESDSRCLTLAGKVFHCRDCGLLLITNEKDKITSMYKDVFC